MMLTKFADSMIKTLQANKASDIKILDSRGRNPFADIIIIASANSNRQIIAIADKLAGQAKKNKVYPLSLEGKQYGEWVLIDFGDVIVHIMDVATREYYQLEELWSTMDSLSPVLPGQDSE